MFGCKMAATDDLMPHLQHKYLSRLAQKEASNITTTTILNNLATFLVNREAKFATF
jgi:hypothetical protein